MKGLFIIILCFVTSKAFSQTGDVLVEEKASDWIKVTSTASVSRPKTTTTIRKKTSSKPATPKKDTQEEFDKTNSQVNRFKKTKKG